MKWLVFFAALGFIGCESTRPHPVASTAVASEATHGVAAAERLDRLDRRAALPLSPMMAQHQKENMRDHLLAVQEIVAATADQDFDRIAQAAQRIGYSESMGRMCEHMGALAPGFTELALTFHHTADRIAEGAKSADQPAVLRALGDTLAQCTKCHATYKQKLIDELQLAPER